MHPTSQQHLASLHCLKFLPLPPQDQDLGCPRWLHLWTKPASGLQSDSSMQQQQHLILAVTGVLAARNGAGHTPVFEVAFWRGQEEEHTNLMKALFDDLSQPNLIYVNSCMPRAVKVRREA